MLLMGKRENNDTHSYTYIFVGDDIHFLKMFLAVSESHNHIHHIYKKFIQKYMLLQKAVFSSLEQLT